MVWPFQRKRVAKQPPQERDVEEEPKEEPEEEYEVREKEKRPKVSKYEKKIRDDVYREGKEITLEDYKYLNTPNKQVNARRTRDFAEFHTRLKEAYEDERRQRLRYREEPMDEKRFNEQQTEPGYKQVIRRRIPINDGRPGTDESYKIKVPPMQEESRRAIHQTEGKEAFYFRKKKTEEEKREINVDDESTHDHEERARWRKPSIEGRTIGRRATYNPISDEETHRRAVDFTSNFESHEDSNNNGTPKDKNLKTKEETHRAAVTFIESNINDTERENPFYNALQRASEDAYKKKAAGNKADEPPADETPEEKKYRHDLFERDKRKLDINLRDLGRKLSPQAQEHTGDLLAHERFMQNKQMKEEKFSTTMPGKLEHMAISLTKEGAKAFGTSGKSAKDKLPKHSKKGKPPHRESYSSRAVSMFGGAREGSSGNLYQGVAMESANMRQRQYFGNGQGPPVAEQNQAAPLTERPPLDYFGPAKNMEHFGSSKQKKTSDFNIGNIGIGGNRNLRDLGIGKRRGSLDLGIGGKKSQTEYGVGKKMAQKDFGIGKGLDIGIGNGKKQSFDFSKELGIGGNGNKKKQKFY